MDIELGNFFVSISCLSSGGFGWADILVKYKSTGTWHTYVQDTGRKEHFENF